MRVRLLKTNEQRAIVHKKNRSTHLGTIIIVCLLAGCTAFIPPKHRDPAEELPQNYSLFAPSHSQAESTWWEHFESPELNRLIADAMGQNFSIRQATARLNQAKAITKKVGADRWPQLDYEAEVSVGRSKTEGMSGRSLSMDGRSSGTGERSFEEYSLGLTAGYEIDLWGRISSQQQATLLDESATKEDLYTAAMTIAGEVAQCWVDIITQRMEQKILAKQLETNQTLQELVDLRFQKGMVSALDVYQQKQALAGVKANLPLVQLQEIQLMHHLAYLLGQSAKAELNIQTKDLPKIKTLPAIGIPADLLANRPDIRAAGLRLKSADWAVSAAKADRLPALRLTARATYSSEDFSSLFDNWILNLMNSLTGPIFDGHSRKAEVLRTEAAAKEHIAAYGDAVYLAIKEVEDLLAQEEKHRQHLAALEQQLEVSQNALEEAGQRYISGLNDYLPVLTQILSNQSLERDILQMKRQLITDRIGLFRAIGGSWPKEIFNL
jgi:NodT family efflux transporter outer membrane factor (OMF) lipoprotein